MKPSLAWLKFTVLAALPLAFAPSSAIAILSACPPAGPNGCGQCEQPLVDSIVGKGGFFEQAKQGKFKTRAEFFEAMKKDPTAAKIFDNTIIVNNSRSAQTSNAATNDFRYILKSPESDIEIGVTTAEGKGKNKLEFTVWNGARPGTDLYELCFPREGECRESAKSPPLSASAPPKGHGAPGVPPSACIECHKYPPRPNWDTYRFWSGSIPYNPDRLVIGTPEADWYITTLKKMASDPILKNSTPPTFNGPGGIIQAKDLEGLDKGVTLAIRHEPQENISGFGPAGDPPSVRLFDQLSFRNTCRIAQEQSKNPKTRYAFAAAVLCSDSGQKSADHYPPEKQKQIADYFNGKGIGSGGAVTFDDVRKDTQKRANRHYVKKLALQLESMIGRLGTLEKAEESLGFTAARLKEVYDDKDLGSKNINSGDVQNPNNKGSFGYDAIPGNKASNSDIDAMARTRLLLEPAGVKVQDWSMSVDFQKKPQIGSFNYFEDDSYANQTFSFSDIYSSYLLDAPFFSKELNEEFSKDAAGKDKCAWLAEKSKAALQGSGPAPLKPVVKALSFKDFVADCKSQGKTNGGVSAPAGVTEANKVARKILQEAAKKTFETCTGCHTSSEVVNSGVKGKTEPANNVFSEDGGKNGKKDSSLNDWLNSKRGATGKTWLETIALATAGGSKVPKNLASMPPGEDMTPEDRAVLLGYLTSVALSSPKDKEPTYACELISDRLLGKTIAVGKIQVDSSSSGAGEGSK